MGNDSHSSHVCIIGGMTEAFIPMEEFRRRYPGAYQNLIRPNPVRPAMTTGNYSSATMTLYGVSFV